MCAKPTAKRGTNSIRLAAAAAAPIFVAAVARAGPFFMGSDISLETFMQQQGVVFKDNSVAAPADQILYNNGNNLFRLRLFVNPNTSYSATEGAIQTTAYDIALAQQIKADDPSAKIELDLHYSDTWADPGKQYIPAAWSGETLSQLQTSVYNYTLSTLNSFKSAGVLPDIVQIGNETNNGMLWPTGQLSFSGSTASQQATWAAYGSLVNSGISAVHAAQGAGPKIQVSLVIGNGNSSGEPAYFYGNLTNSSWGNVPASSFDIMGVDYYPSTNDMSTLSSNLTTLANNFGTKKIMVMETDAPWKTDNGLAHDPAYAETQAGQASYFSALATTVQNLPNGDGMGLLYWYPEAVQVPGYAVYNGGATALFDASGNAVQTIIGTAGAGASGNGDFSITQHQWNTSASGSWNTSGNWTNSTPNGSDVEADFLGAISANQTVSNSSSITLGTIRFQNANTYTLSGSGSLTLQSTVGWAYVVVQQGAQQINLPMTIASDTIFSVAAGSSLTLGSPVTVNSGQILNPSGTGTINYQSSVTVSSSASMIFANSTHASALTLGSGATVAITGTGTVLQVDSLSDAGTIDIQAHSMLVNYGASDPFSTIAGYIESGYNGGHWNGPGIISTTAQTPTNGLFYGVGYADGADGVVSGLASGQIEVKYTLLGDANLDALVNAADFTILAANFNQPVTSWDQGDFNYDGLVNAADFTDLAANFNQSASGAASAADVAALDAFAAANGINLANVPEPATSVMMAMAGLAILARRRRSDPPATIRHIIRSL
ncbi:MAG: glycosyl hydrolase 53 family protein [Tepidisphaeraceae bacterium]|jgi:arabinogalactan endo-1,4-beta-galactosidase